jgi:hypothetical protein
VNVKRLAYLGNNGGPIKIVGIFPDLVVCNGGHGRDGMVASSITSSKGSIWQLGIRGQLISLRYGDIGYPFRHHALCAAGLGIVMSSGGL